jgi:hypothetical protein
MERLSRHGPNCSSDTKSTTPQQRLWRYRRLCCHGAQHALLLRPTSLSMTAPLWSHGEHTGDCKPRVQDGLVGICTRCMHIRDLSSTNINNDNISLSGRPCRVTLHCERSSTGFHAVHLSIAWQLHRLRLRHLCTAKFVVHTLRQSSRCSFTGTTKDERITSESREHSADANAVGSCRRQDLVQVPACEFLAGVVPLS